jgi:hypothetical protein
MISCRKADISKNGAVTPQIPFHLCNRPSIAQSDISPFNFKTRRIKLKILPFLVSDQQSSALPELPESTDDMSF